MRFFVCWEAPLVAVRSGQSPCADCSGPKVRRGVALIYSVSSIGFLLRHMPTFPDRPILESLSIILDITDYDITDLYRRSLRDPCSKSEN